MKMNIKRCKRNATGFTLIEMLLVMVIISIIIMMGTNYLQQRTLEMRIDRASNQMQQILNAAMAYYVSNGYWPADLKTLQTNGAYLPTNAPNTGILFSPWNTSYVVVPNPTTPSSLVYVYFPLTYQTSSAAVAATANIIAGRLPLSYVTATAPPKGGVPPDNGTCALGSLNKTCYVVAAVNVPGQNLNNATAVNYSGIYHSGACVPVPTCPVDQNGLQMTPQIMVVPVSVSGVNDQPSGSPCTPTDLSGCEVNVYPLSSFTASAVTQAKATSSGGPGTCADNTKPSVCLKDASGTKITDNQLYWRVCLSAVTEKGPVSVAPGNSPWGQLEGTVMAITRCVPQKENIGSSFNVWAP